MAVKYILQQQKYDMSGNGSNSYFAKAVPIEKRGNIRKSPLE